MDDRRFADTTTFGERKRSEKRERRRENGESMPKIVRVVHGLHPRWMTAVAT